MVQLYHGYINGSKFIGQVDTKKVNEKRECDFFMKVEKKNQIPILMGGLQIKETYFMQPLIHSHYM